MFTGLFRKPQKSVADLPQLPTSAPADLNDLRASIEATIEEQLHERTVASLVTGAHEIFSQHATHPFYAIDGSQFSTIGGLLDMLQHCSHDAFNHHVTADRNDFATWITHCFNLPAQKLGVALTGKERDEMCSLLAELQRESTPAPIVHEQVRSAAVPLTAPLPPAPIALEAPLFARSSHEKVRYVHEELDAIVRQVESDLVGARDRFIALRTFLWQELDDISRRLVLERFRTVYHQLRHT
jgi:hypothetical protein